MTDLLAQNPLYAPVEFQGQTYFTSQYFHRQYVNHSHAASKYRQHSTFNRLLRSIEAYHIYLDQKDIVELSWSDVKSIKSDKYHFSIALTPLFQASGYGRLTLLNATAQVALSHHLDDELSRQMSVSANTAIARQLTRKTAPMLPIEQAARELEAFLQIGRLLQTPEHIVQQEAVKQIAVSTGVNLRPLLVAAPAQNIIAESESMLEPTELAKTLGIASGSAMNRLLEQLGWQVKRLGGGWEATPSGSLYAARHAWIADHGTKSGYNLRWKVQATTDALQQAKLIPRISEAREKA